MSTNITECNPHPFNYYPIIFVSFLVSMTVQNPCMSSHHLNLRGNIAYKTIIFAIPYQVKLLSIYHLKNSEIRNKNFGTNLENLTGKAWLWPFFSRFARWILHVKFMISDCLLAKFKHYLRREMNATKCASIFPSSFLSGWT